MGKLTAKLAEVKKAVTAACGMLSLALAAGLLHGTAQTVALAVLAVATTLGVYKAENVPAP